MALSPNLRAASFMSISMAAFTMNDAITKGLMDEMNVGQVMFVRGIFATLLVALLAWQQKALHAPLKAFDPLVLARAACELGATVTFLTALAHMPIANVSAVLQSLPLAVTMGAALLFGEPVRWRRWLAISIGFAGVLVIVRPGFEGFNAYAFFALACVVFCALRDLATRRIPSEIPSLLVSTVTAGVVTVFGAMLVAPFGGWTELTVDSTARLAGAAALLMPGYVFIILAMRSGDVSFVAPFRYTALLWAILLGIVFFGELPDLAMLVGAALVIGSGLYSLYRESIVGKRKPISESTSVAMAPDGT
jgi:drug/metabolite transporter (DMT)-like permease